MKAVQLIALGFLLCALALVLPGCMTSAKFTKYGLSHPKEAAQFCADEYPAKDSIIKGKSDTVTRTEYKPGVQLPCPPAKVNTVTGKTETIYVDCPPGEVIYHTITLTDTIVRVDRAIEKLKDIAESELASEKKENKSLKLFAVIMTAAAILLLILVLKK